jgi:multidrug efflux pump subunit AcrB
VRLNGVPSISTGVIRNATANPLDVAAGVRAADAADPARPAGRR